MRRRNQSTIETGFTPGAVRRVVENRRVHRVPPSKAPFAGGHRSVVDRVALLNTQGRALGYTVRGYVHEPTKDAQLTIGQADSCSPAAIVSRLPDGEARVVDLTRHFGLAIA